MHEIQGLLTSAALVRLNLHLSNFSYYSTLLNVSLYHAFGFCFTMICVMTISSPIISHLNITKLQREGVFNRSIEVASRPQNHIMREVYVKHVEIGH